MGQFFSLEFLDGLDQPWQMIAKILAYGLVGGFIVLIKFVVDKVEEGTVAYQLYFGKVRFGRDGRPKMRTHGRVFKLWGAFSVVVVDVREITVTINDLAVTLSDGTVIHVHCVAKFTIDTSDSWRPYWYLYRIRDRDAWLENYIRRSIRFAIEFEDGASTETVISTWFCQFMSPLDTYLGLVQASLILTNWVPDAAIAAARAQTRQAAAVERIASVIGSIESPTSTTP